LIRQRLRRRKRRASDEAEEATVLIDGLRLNDRANEENVVVAVTTAIESKIEDQTIDVIGDDPTPHRFGELFQVIADLIQLDVQSLRSGKYFHASRRFCIAQPQRIVVSARIDPISAATPGHIGVRRHHLRWPERSKRHNFAFAIALNRHGHHFDIVDQTKGV